MKQLISLSILSVIVLTSYTLAKKPRYIVQNRSPFQKNGTNNLTIKNLYLDSEKEISSRTTLFTNDTNCFCSGWFLFRKWEIPPITFVKKPSKAALELNDIFGVKDSNTLVIAISNRGLNYIVYYPNGKITIFKSLGKTKGSNEPIFEEKKINRNNTKPFDSLLLSEFEIHSLKFNQDSLNIVEMVDESGMKNSIGFSHSSYSRIWIWTTNGFSSYSAHEPYAYINGNYPGSSERIKLMNFIERYEELIKTIE